MKSATVCLETRPDFFGPLDEVLMQYGSVSRELIHNIRHLEDGNLLALYEYHGECDELEAAVESFEVESTPGYPEVLGWELCRSDELLFFYQEHSANDAIVTQARLLDEYQLLLQPPIRIVEDGNLCVKLIGSEAEFGQAYEDASEAMDVHLNRIGSAGPEADDLIEELTQTEQRVLSAAVRLGYFENPRQANYDDIADAVDCSKATVGHHIRNAQASLMGTLFATRIDEERILPTEAL